MQVFYSGMVWLLLTGVLSLDPSSVSEEKGKDTPLIDIAINKNDIVEGKRGTISMDLSAAMIDHELSACDYDRSAILLLDLRKYLENSPEVVLSFAGELPGSWIKEVRSPDLYLIKAPIGNHLINVNSPVAQGGALLHEINLNITSTPSGENLACQDTINVTLNQQCQKIITADELLEGNLKCLNDSDFIIEILDEDISNKNIVDGVGEHIFKISLKKEIKLNGPIRWLSAENWHSNNEAVIAKDDVLEIGSQAARLRLPFAGQLSFEGDSQSKYFLDWMDDDGNILQQSEILAGQNGKINVTLNQPSILLIRATADKPMPLFLSKLVYRLIPDPQLLGFETCVGYIKAEDKSAPNLDCLSEIRSGTFPKKIQYLGGELENISPSIQINKSLCTQWPSDVLIGSHYYDTTSFAVSQTGWYAFELDAAWGKGFGAIYEKKFDQDLLCEHLIASATFPSDGLGFFKKINSARIYAFLKPGKTYFLMTTTAEKEKIGKYEWISYAEGESDIIGFDRVEAEVSFPLYCGDIDKILNETKSLEWLDGIRSVEDCSMVSISFQDEVLEKEKCGEIVIRRQLEAKDSWGNASQCDQRIIFSQAGKNQFLPPLHKIYLSCDERIVKDDQGNPHPSMTGYPGILSPFGIRSLRLQECNWLVAYYDQKLTGNCEGEIRIQRLWQIVNWCDPQDIITFKQELIIGDFEAPTFDVQLPEPRFKGTGIDTFVVSTGPFDCSTTLPIPAPVNIKDNCSQTTSKKAILKTITGELIAIKEINGPEVYFDDILLGEYRLVYQVSDACKNTTERELVLLVHDLIAPVAICDDGFNISIGENGIGRVSKGEVDEGSWDACSEVELKVRREVPADCIEEYEVLTMTKVALDTASGLYFSPWEDALSFVCCDLLKEVRVELLVTDKYGNSDYCWQDVLVEDKIPPICIAPPSDTIDCTEYLVSDITDSVSLQKLFGIPQVKEEYCPSSWIEFPATWEDYGCNEGKLTRKFMAIDASGNRSDTCYQHILVEKIHNYEIKFPKDVLNYKCSGRLEDTMTMNIIGCDVLAINIDTLIYAQDGGDGCGEWHIVHRVINWCEVSSSNPVPVGISRNEDGDELMGEEDVYVMVRPDGTAFVDDNNDETDGFLREVSSTGYWEYTQVIEILDTIQPIIIPDNHEPFCTYSDDCIGRVNFYFTTFDLCSRNNITIRAYYDENNNGDDEPLDDDQVRGRVPKFRLTGDYPVGDHSFRVEIIDGCGNKIIQRFPFSVIDCKAPAPICIDQLAIELMPVFPPADVDGDGDEDKGMNVIWASDFRPRNVLDDCHPEIRYSIHRVNEVAHPDSTNLILTCDDPDLLEARVYAWDNAYNPLSVQPDSTIGGPNYDYCTVYIDIQDNQFNLCDGDITVNTIAGNINTHQGVPVPGVLLQLSGEAERSTFTNEEGVFGIGNVRTGYDYTLSPSYLKNPMDGVTTFDLVLMSKHILGIQDFDLPYQTIAADINNSGSVSSLDLIQLRKMILNLTTEFPNNSSWRFVDATYSFGEDPGQWLTPYPEWININNFNPFSEKPYDFIAIKTGDINFSNSLVKEWLGRDAQPHSEPIVLSYKTDKTDPNNVIVSIHSAQINDLEGFQFTLAFDPEFMEFAALDEQSSILSANNIGLKYIEEGLLTFSWNKLPGEQWNPETNLLKLHFRQVGFSTREFEHLQLNARLIASEAYDLSGSIRPLLLMPDEHIANEFKLAGAAPNPFVSQTDISFFLPEEDKVTIDVIDYSGKRILQKEFFFDRGWQHITIHDNELEGSGLYFYTVANKQSAHSGKLVLLD